MSNAKKLRYILAMLLIMLVCVIMPWTYARYTLLKGYEEQGRVARFEIGCSSNISEAQDQYADIILNAYPGMGVDSPVYFSFSLINRGEVAVACIIDYIRTGELPIKTVLKNSSGETLAENAECIIVSEPGTTLRYDIYFYWPHEDNDSAYAGKSEEIKLHIKYEQID